MCYIGDGNNMANSLIVGGLKTGMKVSIATPADYRPDAEVMAFAEPNPNFFITDDPMKAARTQTLLSLIHGRLWVRKPRRKSA